MNLALWGKMLKYNTHHSPTQGQDTAYEEKFSQGSCCDDACWWLSIIVRWNCNIQVDGIRRRSDECRHLRTKVSSITRATAWLMTGKSKSYRRKVFRRIYGTLVALEVVMTMKSVLVGIWVTSDEAVESHWYTARTTSPQTFTRHWLCKEIERL